MNPYEEELLEQEASTLLLKSNIRNGIEFGAFVVITLLGFAAVFYFACNVSGLVQSYFN